MIDYDPVLSFGLRQVEHNLFTNLPGSARPGKVTLQK